MELTTLTELPQFTDHELKQLSEFDLDALIVVEGKELADIPQAMGEEEGLYAILNLLMCSPLFVWLDANQASLFIKNQMPWHIDGKTLNLRPLWNYLQKEEGIQQEALYSFFEELDHQGLPWTLLMPWDQPAASLDTQLELPQVTGGFEPELISYELDGLIVEGVSQENLDELEGWLQSSENLSAPTTPEESLARCIEVIEGVIQASPMSIWVNTESFRMYLERRLLEYVRGDVLDLEPIYDNLSRIPGSPPGVLEIVVSELTRQSMPWRVCLPRHLSSLSWLQSGNVVSRNVYETLTPLKEPQVFEPAVRPQTSSSILGQTSSLKQAVKQSGLPQTSSSLLEEAARLADAASVDNDYESISVDDLLSDLPDDILKQLEVLLVDPDITEKARSMREPTANKKEEKSKRGPKILSKQKGAQNKKRKALAKTGQFPAVGAAGRAGVVMQWLLQQFTRRALLLVALLVTLCLSLWLNSLANNTHQGRSRTAKMFQRNMPLVSDSAEQKAKKAKKKDTAAKDDESSDSSDESDSNDTND